MKKPSTGPRDWNKRVAGRNKRKQSHPHMRGHWFANQASQFKKTHRKKLSQWPDLEADLKGHARPTSQLQFLWRHCPSSSHSGFPSALISVWRHPHFQMFPWGAGWKLLSWHRQRSSFQLGCWLIWPWSREWEQLWGSGSHRYGHWLNYILLAFNNQGSL